MYHSVLVTCRDILADSNGNLIVAKTVNVHRSAELLLPFPSEYHCQLQFLFHYVNRLNLICYPLIILYVTNFFFRLLSDLFNKFKLVSHLVITH